jgi:hypothetical protein
MTAVPNKPGAIKAGGPGSGRHAGGGFGSVAQSHGYTSTGRDANGNHTYTKTDSAGKTHDLSVNHGTGRWSHDVTTPASNTELRNSSTVGRFSGKTSELTPENGAALLKEHLSKWD